MEQNVPPIVDGVSLASPLGTPILMGTESRGLSGNVLHPCTKLDCSPRVNRRWLGVGGVPARTCRVVIDD
jgi:hypothetical protein